MSAKHIGIRIRTPNISSRFGIPLDSPTTFGKLIAAVKRLPAASVFGIHFRMASSLSIAAGVYSRDPGAPCDVHVSLPGL